jgi:hypothetical protein
MSTNPMTTPSKIALAVVAVVALIIAGIALMLAYQPTAAPALDASPPPAPSSLDTTDEEYVNPFDAAAVNPFEDTAAANPFATPEADSEYVNPFSDL